MSRTSLVGAVATIALGGTLLAAPPATETVPSRNGQEGFFSRMRVQAEAKPVAPAPRLVTGKPTLPGIIDTLEVVVFTPARPVRVRVHLQSEGKKLSEVWQLKLRTMFDYFDRDKNGFLNEVEVQNIFSDTGLTMMLQNGFYQPTPQDRPSLDRLDLNGDRKVSFDEFMAYYKQASKQLFRPMPTTPENPASAAVTQALFKLMDKNEDGVLTKEEVLAVEKILPLLDADEDECLSLNELVPNMPNQQRQFQVQSLVDRPQRPTSPASQIVNTFTTGRIPGTLVQQLIQKYDKDGDFELTREECGFDEQTFTRLDTDGNGKLDGGELDVWRTGQPDLEVLLGFAAKPSDGLAKLLTDEKEVSIRGFTWHRVDQGRLIIRTGRHPIEFMAGSAVSGPPQAMKAQFEYLFAQAAGKKGYVEEKDISGQNAVQFQFLRIQFDAADADGDGKLTRKEFDAYFDMLEGFRSVSLGVTPAVQTPTLFQLLDENKDGRLSVRELRSAWDRLIALESPGSTVVTKAVIQPTVSVRLTQVFDRFTANQFAIQLDGRIDNRVKVPQEGPLWFRRMDRNGDGDVSRSEFLGTKEEFDAIDTDRDGLISLAEAEAYEKKMRPLEEKKEPTGSKKPVEKPMENPSGK